MASALQILALALVLSLGYPLWQAWKHPTSLRDAAVWLALCWLVRCVVLLVSVAQGPVAPLYYLGLSLLACVVIAILGARQPGMRPWNFVVGGFLLVSLLPLIEESWSARHWHLDGYRGGLVAAVLAIGVLNYLPTRMALPALLIGLGCGVELWWLMRPEHRQHDLQVWASCPPLVMAAAFWWAYLLIRRPRTRRRNQADAMWQRFRDVYGFVWARRVQMQFNAAAGHAGLTARLGWKGLEPPVNDEEVRRALSLLETLQKPFYAAEDKSQAAT